MLKNIFTVATAANLLILGAVVISAQGFPGMPKMPKVPKVPKIQRPQPTTTPTTSPGGGYIGETEKNLGSERAASGVTNPSSSEKRQMVMDDGYTFFRAEAVKGRNAKNTGDIDVGWRLTATLRLMGTFEEGSGFRVMLKKGAKQIGSVDCEASVYRQDKDFESKQVKFSGDHDDFLQAKSCAEPAQPFTEIGMIDVEIYLKKPDGSLGGPLSKHKIDVNKLPVIKGRAGAPEPGVSEYVINRHAEVSAGILFTGGLNYRETSMPRRLFDDRLNKRQIYMYLPVTPDKRTYTKPIIECTVNGQDFPIKLNNVSLNRPSTATYFYESAQAQRYEPKFLESISFTFLTAALPLSTGKANGLTDISGSPGNWQCKFVENGEVYRIIKFKIGEDGEIEQHAEQKNGNINLYHRAFLVDVEIPESSKIDERLVPMPNAGIFYGIPLTSSEARSAAAQIKPRGKPFPVMPK